MQNLKTTRFWPHDKYSHPVRNLIGYLEKYFSPKTNALIANYFCKRSAQLINFQGKAAQLSNRIFKECGSIIETGITTEPEEKFQDEINRDWIPFAYIVNYSTALNCIRKVQEVANFAFYTITFTNDTLVSNNIDWFGKQYTGLDDPKGAQILKQQQNQLLSLFRPFNKWKSIYHTRNTKELAIAAYQTEQWPQYCPILADALMDAGCEDDYILWLLKEQNHLFSRGMWLIDKLAGKI